MHDSNHTDDFEDYLRQQVNEHRMYPSDRVWKNIRGRIHTPRKWPALSVFTVLIISALVIGTILNKPIPDSVTPNFIYSLQSPANIAPLKSSEEVKNNEQLADNNYSIDQLTSRTIIAAVEKIKIDEAVAMQLSGTKPAAVYENTPIGYLQNISAAANTSLLKTAEKNQSTSSLIAVNAPITFKNIDNYLFDVTSRLRSILNTEPVHYSRGGVAFFTQDNNDIIYNNNFDLKVPYEHKDLLPGLDKLAKTSSRFDFRFYVAPSVSYRRLKEKDQASQADKNSGTSLESDYRIDPSKAIDQTPALGFETGFGLGYKLNKKFSLTGGLQFNISQYNINAFLYKSELAAVTLNEGEYSSTINTISSLRSIPGTAPVTIKNRYYQIAIPLGIEWHILGNGRFSWGMGTSVQPTYTFDKQPLIISSNYKNYTDASAYVRNWNINANAETFLGYNIGSYRWQVGPQIRYQMLPSLVDKYPNKEYLFNYGLKVGVVKQLK